MDISTISIPELVTYILGLIFVVGGGAGGVAFAYKGKFFGAIQNLIVIISSAVVLLEQMVDVFSASMTAISRSLEHVKILAQKAKDGLEDNKLTPEEWTGIVDEFMAAIADINTAQTEAEKIYPQIEIIMTQLKELKQKFNPLVK
jgi:hypothetical protein